MPAPTVSTDELRLILETTPDLPQPARARLEQATDWDGWRKANTRLVLACKDALTLTGADPDSREARLALASEALGKRVASFRALTVAELTAAAEWLQARRRPARENEEPGWWASLEATAPPAGEEWAAA